MSELKQTIRADLKTAMKAKEKQRTSAIRALLAAIQAEETNGSRHELEDADILKVIAREIKSAASPPRSMRTTAVRSWRKPSLPTSPSSRPTNPASWTSPSLRP